MISAKAALQTGNGTEFFKVIDTNNILPTFDSNYALRLATDKGYLRIVKKLVAEYGVDPSANDNYALRSAAKNGYVDIVNFLLEDARVDPSDADHEVVISALDHGHYELIERMVANKHVDPAFHSNYLIKVAAYHGQPGLMKKLLEHPGVDPSAGPSARSQEEVLGPNEIEVHSFDPVRPGEPPILACEVGPEHINNQNIHQTWPIVLAVRGGNVDCVKALIEDDRVDTSVNDYQPFRIAMRYSSAILNTLLKAKNLVFTDRLRILLFKRGHLALLKSVDKDLDLAMRNNYMIKNVTKLVDLEILLKDPRVDPAADDNRPLKNIITRRDNDAEWWTRDGAFRLIERLLADDRVVPTHEILVLACKSIHMTPSIIATLLASPGVDPAYNDNEALCSLDLNPSGMSSAYASIILKALLADERVDPSARDNFMLRKAIESGNTICIEQLLACSRLDADKDLFQKAYHLMIEESVINASLGRHTDQLKFRDDIDPIACNYYALRYMIASDASDANIIKFINRYGIDASVCDNYSVRCAAYMGRADLMRVLLENDAVDPASHDDYALRVACAKDHVDIVKALLADRRVDPAACDNYAIKYAARTGRTELVRMLLNIRRVNPATNDNYPLRWAARNGHTDIVRLLLQCYEVDPTDADNYAFKWALTNAHMDVVEALLVDRRVDPAIGDNYPFKLVCSAMHEKIIEMLLKDGRVDPAAGGYIGIALAAKSMIQGTHRELLAQAGSIAMDRHRHLFNRSWWSVVSGDDDVLYSNARCGNPAGAGSGRARPDEPGVGFLMKLVGHPRFEITLENPFADLQDDTLDATDELGEIAAPYGEDIESARTRSKAGGELVSLSENRDGAPQDPAAYENNEWATIPRTDIAVIGGFVPISAMRGSDNRPKNPVDSVSGELEIAYAPDDTDPANDYAVVLGNHAVEIGDFL